MRCGVRRAASMQGTTIEAIHTPENVRRIKYNEKQNEESYFQCLGLEIHLIGGGIINHPIFAGQR
jgi:hypothetical protein